MTDTYPEQNFTCIAVQHSLERTAPWDTRATPGLPWLRRLTPSPCGNMTCFVDPRGMAAGWHPWLHVRLISNGPKTPRHLGMLPASPHTFPPSLAAHCRPSGEPGLGRAQDLEASHNLPPEPREPAVRRRHRRTAEPGLRQAEARPGGDARACVGRREMGPGCEECEDGNMGTSRGQRCGFLPQGHRRRETRTNCLQWHA